MKAQAMEIDGIQFSKDDILFFEEGLPGFENLQQFLITSQPGQEPFHWMHSLEEDGIKFILVNPMMIHSDYDPKIPPSFVKELNIKSKEDLCMYVIVTLNAVEFSLSTANLLGPIMVNLATRRGKQIILDDGRYSTKYPILSQQGGN